MDTCHTPRRLKAFTACLALACAPLAAVAAGSTAHDEAVAGLMNHWQQRIVAERLRVEDAAGWSRRHMARFSAFDAERLRLAQQATTLEELELLLAEPPLANGTRLAFALAADARISMLGGTAARPKASPASSPAAYADLAFTAVAPCRIYDSRPAQGGTGIWTAGSTNAISIGPNTSYLFQGGSAGDCGMTGLVGTGKIAAVMASVATTSQAGAGFLTFFSYGAPNPYPYAVSQAYQAGSVQTSFVIIPTDLVGAVQSAGFSSNQTHVIIDILGYFAQPKATALDCTSTAPYTVSVPAGASAQPVAPACTTGYALVGTRCASASSAMSLVGTSGTCLYQNDDTAPHTATAYGTCCRTAGR